MARSRRALRPLLLTLALAASSPAPGAADGDLQPLAPDSPLARRLGALGEVIARDRQHVFSMGTGFLITACHVLTAAHVLGNSEADIKTGLRVGFVPSSSDPESRFFDREVFGSVVATGGRFLDESPGATFDVDRVARDWALIELDRPIADIEPLKLLYPPTLLSVEARLLSVGYPAMPHMSSLYADTHCTLVPGHQGPNLADKVLILDCAVRQGMSGGPLLIDGGDRPIAAGILVERFQVGDKVLAAAVPSRAFADQITPVLRNSSVCAAGQPFALPEARTGG